MDSASNSQVFQHNQGLQRPGDSVQYFMLEGAGKVWRTHVGNGDINGTARRIRAVRFPVLEAALGLWVQGHEALRHIVTGQLIIEKGKQIAKHLKISEDSISSSPGWLASFKE